MNADELLKTQRDLRHRLLDDARAIQWPRARDLTAQMLLRLDDPQACWQLGTSWLQAEMDADRITAGFYDTTQPFYSPSFETLRPRKAVPSLVGTRFRTSDPVMATMLSARQTVVFENVSEKQHVQSGKVTHVVETNPVSVKLGVSLRDGDRTIGLVCAHWIDPGSRVSQERCTRLTEAVNVVMGPILSAADRLAEDLRPAPAVLREAEPQTYRVLESLTPAELRLAKLAVTGMTYKEIARHLNRSFSTVDHHLRNIREKLGVRSATRLVTVLTAELQRAGLEAR
ncbi:MAG: helix-turn-helix transcriptional regulator [Polaromonas sp.]|nr:helix-turn-helix transcriptional regulator [Polaromonas sp.]